MIAGIDFSTKAIDVVLLEDDTDRATWHRFGIADKRGAFYAARNVRAFLPGPSWWEKHGVWLIGLEDPPSRNYGTAKALGMIAGALACRLPLDLTVVRTPPHEWKRIACGKANASKDEVKAEVRSLWPEPGGVLVEGTQATYHHNPPQDAYDAYCVAYTVRYLNALAISGAA